MACTLVSLFAPTVYTSMMLSNGAANKHENAKTSDKLFLEANVIAMVEKCCFGPAKILGLLRVMSNVKVTKSKLLRACCA